MKNLIILTTLLTVMILSACGSPDAVNKNNQTATENKETRTEKKQTETANKQAEKDKTEADNSTDRHIKVKSQNSFDDTYAKLKKTIESKESLSIVAELDHSENAKKAEMELRPTKIIMFGNPKLGTPLMKENPTIGIDLPQKMLVYEDVKGDVYIVYNNPKSLADNHSVKSQAQTINTISDALKNLAETAAKKEEK